MPRARTILAFDFGTRRLGIAIGNTVTGSARALETLDEPVSARRFERIGALLGEWHPDTLVVGRPLQPDGAANAITLAAERFARQLHGRFGLPVALVDERYSTVAARERIRDAGASAPAEMTAEPSRRSRRTAGRSPTSRRGCADDAAAAAVILEQYLAAGSDDTLAGATSPAHVAVGDPTEPEAS